MEIHELKDYEISTDFDLSERKADYFASQMIFGSYDLYDYFNSLKMEDFIFRVSHCMKSFKAPYKAVLIQLYQAAKINNNDSLQEHIRNYFDRKFSVQEWSGIFQECALDDSLVKPSLITNLNPVICAIKERIKLHPNVGLYEDNLRIVLEWERKYKTIQREMKESLDGELQ
jgi:hypothetical protein